MVLTEAGDTTTPRAKPLTRNLALASGEREEPSRGETMVVSVATLRLVSYVVMCGASEATGNSRHKHEEEPEQHQAKGR